MCFLKIQVNYLVCVWYDKGRGDDMYYSYIERQTIEPWLYSVRRGAYNKAKKGFSVNRTHLYPYANIHYVEKGSVEVIYGHKHYRACAGQYFILPPFKDHSYRIEGLDGAVLKWIEYDGSESEAMTNRIVDFNGSVVVTPPKAFLNDFVVQLEACIRMESVYAKSKMVYELLIDQLNCLKHSCIERVSRDKSDSLENLIQYINKHLDQNLKVADLAKYFGYSTSYLIKMFKKRYDMTPGAYIYQRRISQVKHLLISDDLTLDEMAAQCGFYDAAHLVRRFKDEEGMTPMTYRAEAKQYSHIESN